MALGAQLAKMNDVLFICEPDPRGRKVGGAAELLAPRRRGQQ
jgi:cyanophycin synthetase